MLGSLEAYSSLINKSRGVFAYRVKSIGDSPFYITLLKVALINKFYGVINALN
jgi:hypothetical protein